MDIRIENSDKKAFLYAPYNKEFVDAIKNVGGARWDSEKRAWAIPVEAVEQARDIMRRVYGACDLPDAEPPVSVRLTFEDEVSERWAPVTIFGKSIASASGRDSGARTGEDVVFTQGSPRSGGSIKNWYTIVPEGCIVVLHNVPRAALGMSVPEGVSVEIIDQKPNKSALLEEKEKLLARLAEIDKILKEE